MHDEPRDGFLRSLFDLSFTSFVTGRVIKVLYVLTLVVLVLAYLGIAIAIFSGGGSVTTIENGRLVQKDSGGNTGFGIVWLLILGPLLLFLYTLLYRVFFELLIVIFRIYENVREQTELMRGGVSRPAPPSPGGSSSEA